MRKAAMICCFHWCPDEDEFTSYKELAARSAVDGVVVHAPRVDEKRIAQLNNLNLPFVVHGRSSNTVEKYNWVDVNNERSFFRATQLLIELGHTTIGLINGLADMDFAMRRAQGYRRALKENNIELADAYLTHGEMTEPNGYKKRACAPRFAHPPRRPSSPHRSLWPMVSGARSTNGS